MLIFGLFALISIACLGASIAAAMHDCDGPAVGYAIFCAFASLMAFVSYVKFLT